MTENPYRGLPSVAAVLAAADGRFPHTAFADAVRAELAAVREKIAAGPPPSPPPDAATVAAAAARRLAAPPPLREVINATGVVLHTNLGRSPLAEVAAKAACDAGRGYLNLELDLGTGKRASRQDAIRAGVCRITGAESATAVNNCAAATVLVLRALARGKEVVVSRGQLVEIGGGFRIPEIMAVSGAVLKEVGTTNITRIADYERAIGPETALLMRVHTSNFRVRGFTKAVGIVELAVLGRKHGLPVVDDAGSGAAFDFDRLGLPGEPGVADGIAAGADLVLFSGDKLLGGPQAGLIAGRAALICRIEADPLMRAFRLDKMTLAALEATLRLYDDPATAEREIPTLRMLATPVDELRRRAERLASALGDVPGLSVEVTDDESFVGGGSLPDRPLPSVVVGVAASGVGDAELAARLRSGTPAVVARVKGGRVLFDLRTVFDRQERALADAVRAASSV